MMNGLQLKLLSSEEIGNIFEKCIEFLSERGARVDHEQALKMLEKAGLPVDFESHRVKFPKDIVMEALSSVPAQVNFASRNGDKGNLAPHPNGLFLVGNSTGCRLLVEPESNTYRDVTLADIADYARLTDALDEIDICYFLAATDKPFETLDIHAMKTVLENTSKHIEAQPWSLESVQYLFELAAAAAGSVDALKERPVAHVFSCSTSPFVFTEMDVEVIIQACRFGLPVGAYSLPSSGATAPVTSAGTVLQASIENLAQLVISQIFRPGTPVVCGISSYTIDMLSGRAVEESIESIIICAAVIQVIKDSFQVPVKTIGFGTDSYILDGQAMLEVSLRGIIVALAGGDVLTHAGRLHSALAISPLKLVVDNDVAKIIKRARAGLKAGPDYLAWEEILDMKPGGHYLELLHTFRHCREALRNDLAVSVPREEWEAQGCKDMRARALEKLREIRESIEPPEIDDDIRKDLERIVAHADKHLAN
jgi:trimethylamine:corrinoid methyltransferase-like protein